MKWKKIKVHPKSVFISWLVSYFIIIAICLFISSAVYMQATQFISEESEKANSFLIKQIGQSIDSRLTDIQTLATQISLQKDLQTFYYVKGPLTANERYMQKQTVDNFKVLKSAENFIEKFYVYFDNVDPVFASDGTYDKEILYDLYFKDTGLSYRQWMHMQNQSYTGEFIPLYSQSRKGVNKIIYMKSLPFNDEEHMITLAIWFDASKLLRSVGGAALEDQSSIAVIDRYNRIISQTGGLSAGSITYASMPEDQGTNYLTLSGKKMAVSYITSKAADLKYAVIVPLNTYTEKIHRMRLMTGISIFLCLFISGLLSYAFARKHYNPVKELTNIVSKTHFRENKSKEKNEFNFINDFICSTLQERTEYYKNWEKYSAEMRQNFFFRLLKGEISPNLSVEAILDTYGVRFEADSFGVILFNIEDYTKLFQEQNNEAVSMTKFAISNVVEEISRQNNSGFAIDCDDMIACLVNLDCNAPEGAEELERIASDCKKFYEEQLGLFVTISISKVHTGVREIHTAYCDAVVAMEYRIILGNNIIIHYNDTMSARSEYSYSIATESSLINCIETGDAEKANAILEKIFRENFYSHSITASMTKYFIFSLLITIVQAVNEVAGNDADMENLIDSVNEILKLKTVSDMKIKIFTLIDGVCRHILQIRSRNHNKHLRQQLTEYVMEHYSDLDLGVSSIAEAFQMSSITISRAFKSQQGETLLDFIHKTRVDSAKALLKNTKDNIGTVSEKVGYGNTNTFIRIFKKYEGVTPGKYRETVHPDR